MAEFPIEIDSEWTAIAQAGDPGFTVSVSQGAAFYFTIMDDDKAPGGDYSRAEYHSGASIFSIAIPANSILWLATRRTSIKAMINRPDTGDDGALAIAQAADARAAQALVDAGLADDKAMQAIGDAANADGKAVQALSDAAAADGKAAQVGAATVDLSEILAGKLNRAEVDPLAIPVVTSAEAAALSPVERRAHRMFYVTDGATPGIKLRENLPIFSQGALAITKEYDSGIFQTSGSSVSGGNITFRAFPTGFGQRTIRAKVTGIYNRNPTIYITYRSEWTSSGGSTRLPLLWSTDPDGDEWFPFDNAAADAPNDRWVFSMSSNWAVNTIYLADDYNYTVGRCERLISDLIQSPYSRPTASALDGYRIGTYTARSAPASMVRTCPAIDQYAATVGHGPRVIILTGGIHPDEVRGMYSFEGMVRTILEGTPLGRRLREEFTFLVYPAINSQGIWTGMIRGDIQINVDANRIWAHPTHVSEMNTMYEAALAVDVAALGRCDGAMDFHDDSRNTTGRMVWSRLSDAASQPDNATFIAALETLGPVDHVNSTSDNTIARYIIGLGDLKLLLTVEHGRAENLPPQYYRQWGRDVAQALLMVVAD